MHLENNAKRWRVQGPHGEVETTLVLSAEVVRDDLLPRELLGELGVLSAFQCLYGFLVALDWQSAIMEQSLERNAVIHY